MTKLNPCFACGSESEMIEFGGFYHVGCKECHVQISKWGSSLDAEQCWNDIAQPISSTDATEAFKNVLHYCATQQGGDVIMQVAPEWQGALQRVIVYANGKPVFNEHFFIREPSYSVDGYIGASCAVTINSIFARAKAVMVEYENKEVENE